MLQPPLFDVAEAHRYFAADCFNRCWELIDKPDRTSDEDQRMISLAQASLWHWTERADCAPRNLSIGYWQLSHVYSAIGAAPEARRYADLCLRHSGNEPPFFLGFAYEALARAARAACDEETVSRHLETALKYAAMIDDASERAALEAKLEHFRR
jgi:hypothetical protein